MSTTQMLAAGYTSYVADAELDVLASDAAPAATPLISILWSASGPACISGATVVSSAVSNTVIQGC